MNWTTENGREIAIERNRRYIVRGNRLVITNMDNDLIYEATLGNKLAAKSYASELAAKRS